MWSEIAIGAAPRQVEARLTDHAIECTYCAPLLKAAFQSPAAEARVDAIAIAGTAATGKVVTMRKVTWCIAAGIVGALLLVPAWSRVQLYRAESALAEAEAHQRPNLFRHSDAPYAPVRRSLSGPSQQDVPDALLRAREYAAGGPSNPEAELVRARIAVDLLDREDHSPAIRAVIHHLGASPKLYNELGVAQASHGLLTRNDNDLRAALKSFDQALSLPEGRFNRAAVLFYLDQAGDLCKTVSDPDPRWDADLKDHLHCKQR